ncbi:hypothetical protein BT93_E2444 [Corymbia citriodora subsp. variegata]|nr:hypothetical protein BT93_E2444 [Corymbia citriodora subsp. variegata]
MRELFDDGMSAECNLRTLDLMELPKLEKIGVMMVNLQELKVRRCPNLENLEEVLGEAENLGTLHISHTARLKTIPKVSEKLKNLHIKSCDEMKEVFSPGMAAERYLQTLDLMELPKLEKIGVMMVSLRVLKVRRCPILKNICPLSDLPKELETLQIQSCNEMKEQSESEANELPKTETA